jgi:hypothetical protein
MGIQISLNTGQLEKCIDGVRSFKNIFSQEPYGQRRLNLHNNFLI